MNIVQEITVVATTTGIVAVAGRKVVQFAREVLGFVRDLGKKPSEAK